VITPNPQTTLVYEGMLGGLNYGWVDHGGSWRGGVTVESETVLVQSSLAGDSRYINGVVTEDQIVQARVRPTGFDGTDRWCGIAARYGDAGNFYYLSIRNTNQISLRRVSGGAITVLDSAPLTVSTGDWYTLRLEVVGNKLRGYMNGNLLVEATDSVLTKGQYAMVTYKATARYDDFTVLQP
jgi:pectate lyase